MSIEVETSDLYPDIYLYKPQLVGKSPYENIGELSYRPHWFAQQKIDGYWEALVKENDQVYMFARNKSRVTGFYTQKIDHVPHIKEWAMEQLPNGTMLIGEIYLPHGTSKDVTTILGCKEAKAVQRQQGGTKLNLYLHDILKWNGRDFVQENVDNDTRYSYLCEKVDLGCDLIPEIEIATYKDGIYMDFEQILDRIFAEGGEGLVFKRKEGLYLPGKRRPQEMFKVKQSEDNLDFIVIGFVEPERKYAGNGTHCDYFDEDGTPVTKGYALGWKMGFKIGLYDGDHIQEIGTVTSGLDDAMRQDLAENPGKYLGNVISVSCMSVDKDALSLRHPIFVVTHFDKPAEDCRLEDVFK